MKSFEESHKAWQTSTTGISSLDELRHAVKDKDRISPCGDGGLRSVCWKAFLLFRNFEQPTWSRTLSDSRSAYTALKEHFLRHVEHPEEVESTVDPLTDDDASSPWVTLRHDEALRAEIFQDVERCMPENLYFREPATQKMLVDVLFIFCKLNRDVGYRQGMHELLAPVLWVVERDAIDAGSFRNIRVDAQDTELMRDVLNARFIEHDAFTLFSLVMQTAKTFYEMGDQDERTNEMVLVDPDSAPLRASPIIERSQRIHEEYLASVDPALAAHLKEIDILPQVFLIRWIRLLFGREFPFDELLALWDALFAEDPALNLIDLICVAMLLRIRWQLMGSDYSNALMLLLRYPSPPPPHLPATFVLDAMYLRDDLTTAGGIHLISKYSSKVPDMVSKDSRPTTPRRRLWATTERGPHASQQQQHPVHHTRARSPLGSPARFIQQQGGIEALLQDAAKSVYSRGEKWGVNKAVRGAMGEVKRNVQGFQSTSNSPQGGRLDRARWSLDRGRLIMDEDADQGLKRVHALEQRNKGLAQMLEGATEALWSHRKEESRGGEDAEIGRDEKAIEAFNVAVAKVQFVKVYLEDSTLSLTENDVDVPFSPTLVAVNDAEKSRQATDPSAMIEHTAQSLSPTTNPSSKDLPQIPSPVSGSPSSEDMQTNRKEQSEATHKPSSESERKSPDPIVAATDNPKSRSATLSATTQPPRPTPPLYHSRSTLANSSFSWMLGESERRSDFVGSSLPTPSGVDATGRGGAHGSRSSGFLFGDIVEDDDGDGSGGGVDGHRSKNRGNPERSRVDDEEGFKLGTLRGGKEGS
ncbi:MAG: hypothetical protein M1837_004334 [Sclerophora amabilis]|nr:MAG: hypothetical protein M1837_004334 [Sclerophora amabilis]